MGVKNIFLDTDVRIYLLILSPAIQKSSSLFQGFPVKLLLPYSNSGELKVGLSKTLILPLNISKIFIVMVNAYFLVSRIGQTVSDQFQGRQDKIGGRV